MTTLNSRLLVSQSRSGGRFQVGFGVLYWKETHQQLSGESLIPDFLVGFISRVCCCSRARSDLHPNSRTPKTTFSWSVE